MFKLRKKDTIDFQVAFGAVKHFGRNLYTSNPPAIAEIVANTWDAYATSCHIFYNEETHSLIIADNGIGMTREEFESRYAVSGTEKDYEIRIPDNMEERPYMGRKGIGKFSAFSLGDEYDIYTRSNNKEDWQHVNLNYRDIMSDQNNPIIKVGVEYEKNLEKLTELYEYEFLKKLSSNFGTIIIIPNMRRKFTAATLDSISRLLSRRFSVNISERYNFSLYLDDKEINLKQHFYDEFIEFVYYFGYSKEEIRKRFPEIEKEEFLQNHESNYLKENNIKGWIGSVSNTNDLKVNNELNSNGVIVYINGKLADEDLLKSTQTPRISDMYIIGEVEADFLQNEKQDPVLSSREGLNIEVENVKDLRDELFSVRKNLNANWNDLRGSRKEEKQNYLQDILSNEDWDNLYSKLDNEEKKNFQKYSQRIFDTEEENKKMMSIYVPFLFSVVNSKSIQKVEFDNNDSLAEAIQKLIELFDKSDINTALRLKETHQDRLSIIEKLNKDIDDEAIEKIFEERLAQDPWLINPGWDRRKRNLVTQHKIESNANIKPKTGYIDILLHATEEDFPIIVELKREKLTSYSAPDRYEVTQQIGRYRSGIKKELQSNYGSKYNNMEEADIKAFFIVGSEANLKFDPDDRKFIEKNGIVVKTYYELIEVAQSIYFKSEEILKQASKYDDK